MIESRSDTPVRVLHVFSFFDQGGIENFVMNVYRKMDRTKVQFDFAFPVNQKGYFDDEVISMGGRIFFFDSEKIGMLNFYRNLKRIISENGPYVAIHSHLYYFSGYILWVAKRCGIKIRISHSHETSKGRKETFIRKTYENVMRRMIKRNATHWLSCSDAAGRFVFCPGTPYQVLYNGIDLERFRFNEKSRNRIRKELGMEDSFIVLNVGRFAHQKNHPFIISLFNELLKKKDNARLLLIGTGDYREMVENRCKELGISDKVTILYNIQNTEEYYDAADAFILPSHYEGMSIVSVEAQSTGLPTLISDKVTREVGVTDLAKYLPIDGTEQLWADELYNISLQTVNREEYMSKFISTPFNVDVTVRDLINIYTSQNA